MGKLVDLTGQIFGRLTVLGRAEDYFTPKGKRFVQWHCKCECGKNVTVLGMNLREGRSKSCGCLISESSYMRNLTDLTGQRFAMLTVISRADDHVDISGDRYVCWRCVCDCGNEKIIRASSLKQGLTKSCGCLRKRRRGGSYIP